MTSVDSGVEMGNDSNDGSIVKHENLSLNQISNVSSTVVTTISSEKEVHENEPGTFHIEFGSLDLRSPISSLCPVIENFNYTGDTQSSTPTSSAGPVVECSSKVLEFGYPCMYNVDSGRSNYRRKMKSTGYAPLRSRHYVTRTRKNNNNSLIGREMQLIAALNDTIKMRILLSYGISPNNRCAQGRTPLHVASCSGYTGMVQLLLEHGADPNQPDCIGNTPLHLAAVQCQMSVVTLLIKAGADVLSLDRHGNNPLQLAQRKLKLLQNCKGEDMLKVKEEVHNIVNMLLAYWQKQKDAHEKVETLSTFYSRLSLSNTSDQVQDDVKDLLDSLDALSITS